MRMTRLIDRPSPSAHICSLALAGATQPKLAQCTCFTGSVQSDGKYPRWAAPSVLTPVALASPQWQKSQMANLRNQRWNLDYCSSRGLVAIAVKTIRTSLAVLRLQSDEIIELKHNYAQWNENGNDSEIVKESQLNSTESHLFAI